MKQEDVYWQYKYICWVCENCDDLDVVVNLIDWVVKEGVLGYIIDNLKIVVMCVVKVMGESW